MLWNYSPNHTVSLPRTVESYVQERLHLEDKRTTIPQQAGELLTQWHSVISQNSWILSPRTASSWRQKHYDPSTGWGTTHPMTQCHIPEQLNPQCKNGFTLKTRVLQPLKTSVTTHLQHHMTEDSKLQFLNQQNSYYILWGNHTDPVVAKSKLPWVWSVPCPGFHSRNRHCQLQTQILLFLGDIFLQL